MTIRERIMSVYRNQVPDRIPVGIYSRYHRSGEVERQARMKGLGILDFYPVVSLLAPPWHIQSGFLSEVKNASLNIKMSWVAGKQVETRFYETPIGTISQMSVRDPIYQSDWIKKHYIETSDDYKVMKYIIDNTVFRAQEDAFLRAKNNLGEDGVVLGRLDRSPYQKLIYELSDPQKFFIEYRANPHPAEEIIEVMGQRLDEQFELALKSSADVIWQPDNISSDFTPPKLFERYCLPYYEKRGRMCHEAGKIYVIHIDGRTRALKDLIARCPIDVVESFSFPEIGGDFPVSEAKKAWPNKVICPNFPSPLSLEPRHEIERYLEKVVADFGDQTPFMLQVSEDIPPETYSHVLSILTSFMEH